MQEHTLVSTVAGGPQVVTFCLDELLRRDVTGKDVEMLLGIKIKRISRYDMEKNRKEIDAILAELRPDILVLQKVDYDLDLIALGNLDRLHGSAHVGVDICRVVDVHVARSGHGRRDRRDRRRLGLVCGRDLCLLWSAPDVVRDAADYSE